MRTSPLRKLLLALALTAAGTVSGASAASAATVWAVGDGAYSGSNDDLVAQRIIDGGPFDRFLFLGDVYGDPNPDSATDFVTYYDPSYGRFKSRTSPTPGDHEYPFVSEGYDPYFGALAPKQPNGGRHYSFDLDGWHFVSLNSNTFQPEFSDPASNAAQLAWIGADLSQPRLRGNCTIAYVHRPRYSATTPVGDDGQQQPLWGALEGRVLAVLAGHRHNYQRFVPKGGTVQWIVGTGGKGTSSGADHTAVDPAGSSLTLAASNATDYGALRLRLSRGRLNFELIALDGSVKDSGSMSCRPHSPRPEVSIRRPSEGTRKSRRLRKIYGTARNADSVSLNLVLRPPGKRCRAFDGKRFRPASCDSKRSFPVEGVASWRKRLSKRFLLPSGRYRLTATATAEGGETALDRVRFRVR